MKRRLSISFHYLPLTALILLGMLAGCKKEPANEQVKPIPYAYHPQADSVLLEMIALEQIGDIAGTDKYLTSRNPTYRYQALSPYSTPRYPERLDKFLPLLSDSVSEVRRAAIYAVGQSANKKAIPYLMKAYNAWDSLKEHTLDNSLILEAIGKCGSRKELDLLTTIKTFDSGDSILIAGQARGIFQLLLKGIFSQGSTDKMTTYFFSPQYPLSIRKIAGYYLMRGRELNMDAHEFALGKVLRSDDHFSLRAYAAAIIANSGSNKYANILKEQITREKNDQVKLNILRAMYNMPYSKVKSVVFDEVDHPNPQISRMAARFFLLNGQQDDAAQYWDKVKTKKLDVITTANFAAATAKNLPFYYALTHNAAINYIIYKIKSSKDPYLTTQLMQVLAELPEYSKTIVDQYKPEAHPAVKSQSIFSIQKAAQVAAQNRKYINTVNQHARRLFDIILADADAGALAAMAYVVRDTASTRLFDVFRRQNKLRPLLDSLSLPKEIETYNEIAQLLNAYGDHSVSATQAKTFRPFNQDIFKKLSNNSTAVVKTTKGDFTINLFPEQSPISTTNFVQLVQQTYFDNKFFHRVVPNFVIQTGCPRGDGYGSQDYVIRSELGPLHYDTAGRVGMASAGNDTESSQWFVTHIPVFHLDGRYTIFGQITDGMDVVNKINVGDKINSININY